mmetsp:Transcript_1273/g.1143  ORF Transcript_1273/g.1143 Transcript_1273/m.1143 type:complete len:155 (+) Transcript_1273:1695-2159(+)
MNEKLKRLRLVEYSNKLEVPDFIKESEILNECIVGLETLSTLDTPKKKLNCLITIINSICTGFMFLANKPDDQASVDDILHLLCYIILSSSAKNLVCELRYIQTFYYFSEEEKFGKISFCLKNLEIALEFLKSINLENENIYEEDDFELHIDEN